MVAAVLGGGCQDMGRWTVVIIFLLIFVVITWLCSLSMGQNPSEYIGTMMWQKKLFTQVRSFLTPVSVAQRGDGSNELESVVFNI